MAYPVSAFEGCTIGAYWPPRQIERRRLSGKEDNAAGATPPARPLGLVDLLVMAAEGSRGRKLEQVAQELGRDALAFPPEPRHRARPVPPSLPGVVADARGREPGALDPAAALRSREVP